MATMPIHLVAVWAAAELSYNIRGALVTCEYQGTGHYYSGPMIIMENLVDPSGYLYLYHY